MADLPTVNAIEDLKESNKEQREHLQRSMEENMRLNRDELININTSIMKAFSINEEMLNLSKAIRAEEYERWLESQRQKDEKSPEVKVKTDESSSDWLLPLLGIGGLAAAFTALAASLTGLDAALKAINLPNTFKAFKAPFKGIANFFDRIRKMKMPKIPELPKIRFVDIKGKPYDFKKFKIKIPDIITPLKNGLKILRFNILGAFGLTPEGLPIRDAATGRFMKGKPLSTQIFEKFSDIFDSIGKRFDGVKSLFVAGGEGSNRISQIGDFITKVFDEVTKPIRLLTTQNQFTEQVGRIGQGISDFFKSLPRIEITLPAWVKNIPTNIKNLIGSAEDGSGVFGFFSKAFSFLEPVLKPLKMVLGTILRPFTQILLTVIDFVVGFYEGFTGAEGSLMDKLGAGLEGGIKGIIKGITEAIDLIFVQFPAWIMGKLGFEEAASNLKEFSLTALVDPIWESIKNFFKTLISGDIGGAMSMVVGGVEDFFKGILRAVLPDPTEDFGFFDPRTALQKLFKAMGAYEYAGIDVSTGERIQPPSPTSGMEMDARSREVTAQQSSPVVSVVAPQTSTTNTTQNNQSVNVASASARRNASSPQNRDIMQGDPLYIR